MDYDTIQNHIHRNYGRAEQKGPESLPFPDLVEYTLEELKSVVEMLSGGGVAIMDQIFAKKVSQLKEANWEANVYDVETMINRHGYKNFALGVEWARDLKARIEEEVDARVKNGEQKTE